MIREDQFEPIKLVAVTERLRKWADGEGSETTAQEQTDVRWLLKSHLEYFKLYEKWERAYWYQRDKEDNGNIAISWKERAEELEKKLEAAESVLWMAEQYAEGHAIPETGEELRDLDKVKFILYGTPFDHG